MSLLPSPKDLAPIFEQINISLVPFAAVIRVVTQRSSPLSGDDRCVMTLITTLNRLGFAPGQIAQSLSSQILLGIVEKDP